MKLVLLHTVESISQEVSRMAVYGGWIYRYSMGRILFVADPNLRVFSTMEEMQTHMTKRETTYKVPPAFGRDE